MVYSIDFGTSNTVVARWNPLTQKPETLSLPNLTYRQGQNPALIPSLLYINNANMDDVTIGKLVLDQGLDITNDQRFFRNFKRGIGTKMQGFLPEIDGKSINFEQIGTWFLQQVIQGIKDIPLTIDSLVLTVPVDSFEAYRYWLTKVCQSLAIEQIRMLDEPTAAALGYGLADRELLLVVDFGGGTLDLSLVRLDISTNKKKPLGFILKWGEKSLGENSNQPIKIARVLAKSGQNLGGSDIDNWLVDYFSKTQKLPQTSLTTRLAERLKIQLSLQNQASEVYFDDENLDTYELSLERGEFDEILQENKFVTRLDEAMSQVLQQTRRQGIEIGDIDAVLLVGGTAQIPLVQTWIKQYFEPQKIRSEKPFEAIAQGALQLEQGLTVQDFLYHSYGVRYWNRRENNHSWHPIIKSGQSYPMSEPVELVLGASVENQPSIELIIGELGTDTGLTEIYFDGDRLLTKQLNSNQTRVEPLNDQDGSRNIAKLTPPGYPGSDRVKVQFIVDEQRFLRITVDDLFTNQTLLYNQPVVKLS